MNRSQSRCILFFLFGFIAGILAAPFPAYPAAVAMDYSLGFNGYFQLHEWTPLTVVLENRGRATSGTLEVIVTSGSEYQQDVYQSTYARDVDLPHNSKKRYAFTVMIKSSTSIKALSSGTVGEI